MGTKIPSKPYRPVGAFHVCLKFARILLDGAPRGSSAPSEWLAALHELLQCPIDL
jgi:hypothetical protein